MPRPRPGDGTTIVSVVGARPNFMKLAPLARALADCAWVNHVIIHTGQHYDPELSETFFRDLGIPQPDHNLSVGSATHATQTAAIMQRFDPVCQLLRPSLVLVYGDVNSTVAAAMVASKLGIRVGHVEAGLRSYDRSMPEEVNRVVTDHLSDLLFVPSPDAIGNLAREGIAGERVHFVGNIMIDSVCRALPQARQLNPVARFGLRPGRYVVATLHRPSNVDRAETLQELIRALVTLSVDVPVVFPVHPRTRARLEAMGSQIPQGSELHLLDPVGYLEMLGLVASAGAVITDSGGVQEETSYLGVPCLTVRPNTERPITIEQGTNTLVEPRCDAVLDAVRVALGRGPMPVPEIDRWDGRTAERIVAVLAHQFAPRLQASA